jgi:ISXO2-like transposase domain
MKKVVQYECLSYRGIGSEFVGGHHTVNHSDGEHVRGDVSVNTAESFFALVKRGLVGIHHNVSRKHLHRYLAHAGFLWNHRELEDGERLVATIVDTFQSFDRDLADLASSFSKELSEDVSQSLVAWIRRYRDARCIS